MKRKGVAVIGSKGEPEHKFVRGFDHVDGNWPSHVYLAGKYSGLKDITNLCLGHFRASVTQCESAIVPIDSPHLSLSKPFVLRFHQINPFLRSLSDLVQHMETFAVVVASKYRMLVNEHDTRRFIALYVEDNRDQILILIEKVNQALRLFQQPSYYQNPIFHISVASMLIKSAKKESQMQYSSAEDADQSNSSASDIVVVTTEMADGLHLSAPAGDPDKANSDDSEDEGSVPDWQRSMCVKHVTTNMSHAPAIQPTTVPVVVQDTQDAKVGLFGHFDDYGSDDDEVCAQTSSVPFPSANITTSSSTACTKETHPALTKVLNFTAVECKIGNRTYRLDFQRSLDSKGGSGNQNYSFYEVK